MRTHSHTSLFHHQLSSFSSTHSSSPLPLLPPPLSLSLFALASFSIHRSPPPPLSLGPGHMRKGRLGRCSSGKKRGEKRSAAISTGRPSPLASLCQKREGFFTTPSPRILTLCLLSLLPARSVPQYHATSGFALLLLRHCCAICKGIFQILVFTRF